MFNLANKKFFEMKLTITNGCVLRCTYCFVNKNSNRNMEWETAKKAIDFFLKSKGKDKILKIYGGEPLLNFDIVEKIAIYINRLIAYKKINFVLSLCTNTILLTSKQIDFFKKNKFQIAISFDGKKETHDKFRKFKNGNGSFDTLVRNCRFIFEIINKKNVAANIGIVPSEVSKLFENFKYIISIGFDTINLEPIYGFRAWTDKHQEEFEKQMKEIINFIFKRISYNQFVFLTTINRELKYKTLSRLERGVCVFDQFLEIYPNGEIGFSSFFLNLPQKQREKYIIGNIARGIIKKKYNFCKYDNTNRRCQVCLTNYFDIIDKSQSSEVVQKRNLLSILCANNLESVARTDPVFKKYINEAKKHICF